MQDECDDLESTPDLEALQAEWNAMDDDEKFRVWEEFCDYCRRGIADYLKFYPILIRKYIGVN